MYLQGLSAGSVVPKREYTENWLQVTYGLSGILMYLFVPAGF